MHVGVVALLLGAANGWAQTTAARYWEWSPIRPGRPSRARLYELPMRGTNDTRQATSDQLGNFIFPNFKSANNTLTVEMAGFQNTLRPASI